MGVTDHVLESISGRLSRPLLEHYSHIRIDAKRQALDALVCSAAESCPRLVTAVPSYVAVHVCSWRRQPRAVAANGAAPSGAEPPSVTRAFRRAPDGAV